MSPEAQRIAIAEAHGTHRVVWAEERASLTDKNNCKADYWWSPFEGMPSGYAANSGFIPPLNYLNDLNAMHEAEKVLDSTNGGPKSGDCLRYAYSRELYKLCPVWVQPFRATAAQRAEAFLRTIGKWEKSP